MKGHGMTNFIAELTPMRKGLEHQIYSIKSQLIPYLKEEPPWTPYVDGSSNIRGCGAGLLLISLNRE